MSTLRSIALGLLDLVAPALAWGQGAPQIEWFGPGHVTIQTVALSPDGSLLESPLL